MSGKKKYRKHVRWLVLAIVFGVLMLIMFATEGSMSSLGVEAALNSFLGATAFKKVNPSDDVYYASSFASQEALQEHEDALCTELEEEGAALLKNATDSQGVSALPLSAGTKVSLFSESSYDFIYCGTGSGEVNTDSNMTLTESLEKAGLKVNPDLASLYAKEDYHRVTPETTGGHSEDYLINEMPVSRITTDVKNTFSDYSTAIVTLSRSGGEGSDLPYGDGVTGCEEGCADAKNGDYLLLNDDEADLLSMLEQEKSAGNISKIIVLLNSSNTMQLDFLDSYGIDAVLWVGDVGQTGIRAIGEILTNQVNPSGRIVDTFLRDNKTSPAMANFGVYEYSNTDALGLASAQNNNEEGANRINSRYLVYEEDIYVGYRYYETRYEDYVMGTDNAVSAGETYDYSSDVAYPFGYGLSYTDTSSGASGEWLYSGFSVTDNGDAGTVTVSLTVTNDTGVSGKHTVQIYMQSPYTPYDIANGVEKPAVELVGFDKISLAAGASAPVTITVDKYSMAAYDSNSAETYIVDPGTYYFTAAHDAHEAVNNVLAQKIEDQVLDNTSDAVSSKMDAAGDTELVGSVDVKLDDSNCRTDAAGNAVNLTYQYSTTGAEVCNQFDNADLNKYEGANKTVTYLTRSDWTGTWPQTVTSFAVTEQMWEDGLAPDDASYVGPDGRTDGASVRASLVSSYEETYSEYYKEEYGTEITMPVTDAEVTLKLYDLMTPTTDADGNYTGTSIDWNDTRWSTLMDQTNYASMIKLIYNGYRQTVAIDTIGLPGTLDSDGPQGLTNAIVNGSSSMGYTSEDIMAATFSRELVADMGECIAEDFMAADNAGIYGPGANIHRTPYSGRNYEYYSEDSFLSGEMAASEVEAISSKGVMVFMKHCVLNDQENGRLGLSTFANEQSIRELYLKNFESAMKVGHGVGVMTSFNRIGVVWSGADFNLMTNVLRGEFGMDGTAITDCSIFATPMDYRLGVLSGQNLWCGMSMNMNQLDGYDDDPVMVTAVRESAQRIAYTVAQSLAMNNMGPDTTVKSIMPWWGKLIIALGVIFLVLMALCIFMYVRSCMKAKKNRLADGVDKKGRPIK